jgi:hypothetical protein
MLYPLYHSVSKGAQIMAKDIKLEDDFFKKHLKSNKIESKQILKFDTLISLAVNGHYPLFFPQWIKESIDTVKGPISSKDAKVNVNKMIKLIDGHNTLAKKRTALLSLRPKERSVIIKSFIKLVELQILDNYGTGLQ